MLGKASEIKTKRVEGENFGTDEMINNFLELNPSIEVIDIKFSTSYESGYGNHETALIIYKEVES